MTHCDGHDAFVALSHLLDCTQSGEGWRARSPAIERLRHALLDPTRHASALDLAVLLRQAMTHEHVRRGATVLPAVMVKHPRFDGFNAWDAVSLRSSGTAEARLVTLQPWTPAWLAGAGASDGVEVYAASEATRREFNNVGCEGDPLLVAVGRTSYRSRGQRAAVRAALSTPAGGSLVVALPTGEGKSMIFQLIQAVGFIGADLAENRGVTLVIVPTVALGVNHEQEAVNVCGLSPPLAFQGGNDVQNNIIAERIADGTQGLCFASPDPRGGPAKRCR